MQARSSGGTRSLLTVLYVGEPGSVNQARLRDEGIGVVAVASVSRALRLLSNFRVAAIICDTAELPSFASLTATQTPVIALDGEGVTLEGVTVVSRQTPASALAAVVRQLAAATVKNPDRNAA